MKNSYVRYITLTALMLAVTVLFQMLRVLIPAMSALVFFGPFNLSVLVVGSLVNLALIITAWRVGFWSGVTVSVLSTVIALMQGHLPGVYMLPVVSIGNIAIVTVVWLLRNQNRWVAVVAGAIVKFLALWAMVSLIVVPIFSGNEAMAKVLTALSITFSWPQLLTALLGGALACILWPRLKMSARGV